MWKFKEDERPPIPTPAGSPPGTPGARENRSGEPSKVDNFRADVAHIGKSVIVKGQLSGSEDLYLDGEVEGSIELAGHSLIIGPHGRVRANVHARDVIVHGKVDGNVHGTERVELKKSGILVGDILTQRIVIEDGAYFKGGIDIEKVAKSEAKRDNAAAAVASGPGSASAAGLLETKK